jgi:hypothetical protein
MSEKKNNDYEKPESKGMGDELEDVSGGAGATSSPWDCTDGSRPEGPCQTGPAAHGCGIGSHAGGLCSLGDDVVPG